jgi:hypothetical protein
VPSGEKPSIASVTFVGRGTTTGLPPRAFTSATESGLCPQPQPSSRATVSRLGESMNHGVPLKSFVVLPPLWPMLKSSKFETNAIRLPAAHNTGSQHESAEYRARFALPYAALMTSTRPRGTPRYANAICVPSGDHVGFAASSRCVAAGAARSSARREKKPNTNTASATRAMSGM